MQLFVTWFTVFSTINLASLGWVATAAAKTGADKLAHEFVLVAVVYFVVNNAAGIFSCLTARRYFEKVRTGTTNESNDALAVYSVGTLVMAGTLLLNVLFWVGVAFVFRG